MQVPVHGTSQDITPERFYDTTEILDKMHHVPGSHGRERMFRNLPTRGRQPNVSRLAAELGQRNLNLSSPEWDVVDNRDFMGGGENKPLKVWHHPLLKSRCDMEWSWP